METLKPGDTLGPYPLVERVGKGGSGIVWKAKHLRAPDDINPTPRYVAIKVYKEKVTVTELEAEVGRWEKIPAHPNILTLIEPILSLFNTI